MSSEAEQRNTEDIYETEKSLATNDNDGNCNDDDEFVDAPEAEAIASKAVSNDDNRKVSKYGGRTCLPARAGNRDFSLLQLLKQCIGKEVYTITMPVIINEPLGFLQRLAEYMEYCGLLFEALQHHDKIRRLELVTAFAVSNFASNLYRLNKPFNPLLGETFEIRRKALGDVHFIAEQVLHHPPVSAYMLEVPGKFRYSGSIEPVVHFRGKHVEIAAVGVSTVEFPEFGDVYTWESPRLNVNNLIFGKMWLELYGDMEVKNHTKACRSVLSFKRTGWFGKPCRKLEGTVYDDQNSASTPVRALYGDWSEGLFSVPLENWETYKASQGDGQKSSSWYSLLYQYTTSSLSTASGNGNTSNGSSSTGSSGLQCDVQIPDQRLLWKADKLTEGSEDYYNFSPLALTLNELTPEDAALNLPPTDSRFRKDVLYLERAEVDAASAEKHRLEEKQRAVRRERKQQNQEWTPLWFDLKPHPFLDRKVWTFNEKYLERDWSQSPNIF